MNKVVLILGGLGLGIGGFLLWKKFYGQGAVAGNVITPYANPQLLAQPAMQYPFVANQAPRNDNQSEPWYGGSRTFNTQTANQQSLGKADQGFSMAVDYIKGFADVSSSVSSIWDDLGVSDWFSDESDPELSASVEDFGGSFNWDSLEIFA